MAPPLPPSPLRHQTEPTLELISRPTISKHAICDVQGGREGDGEDEPADLIVLVFVQRPVVLPPHCHPQSGGFRMSVKVILF